MFFVMWFCFAGQVSSAEEKQPCVVDGHGPYDETVESCLALGRDQARVNCILREQEAVVDYRVGKESGTCRAKMQSGECLRGVCICGNCGKVDRTQKNRSHNGSKNPVMRKQ